MKTEDWEPKNLSRQKFSREEDLSVFLYELQSNSDRVYLVEV